MVEFDKLQLPECFSCNKCGYRSGALKAVCPECGSEGMVMQGGIEKGEVVDFVPVAYPPENLKHLGEYVSVLVKLDNGCQLFGIVLENPDQVKIGIPVSIANFNPQTKELFFKLL
jgi:uncharacterized OB-fold protein